MLSCKVFEIRPILMKEHSLNFWMAAVHLSDLQEHLSEPFSHTPNKDEPFAVANARHKHLPWENAEHLMRVKALLKQIYDK